MRAGKLVLVPLALAGCLPEDTRPPPAEVTVTASPSALTLSDDASSPGAQGLRTADGFDLVIDHFVVNLGQPELGPDGTAGCNVYSNPSYTRTIDFKTPGSGTEHELGVAYATGRCPFGFSVRAPNASSIVEPGVDPNQYLLMRTPGNDPDSTNAGVSVYIEGHATRGEESYDFAWSFRKRVEYSECHLKDESGNDVSGLELASGDRVKVDITLREEALFQANPTAALVFEPFALADTNGDADIEFDELWNVPISAFASTPLYAEPSGGLGDFTTQPCFTRGATPVEIQTLGDYAYCALLPNVAIYEGSGSCTAVTGIRPRDE